MRSTSLCTPTGSDSIRSTFLRTDGGIFAWTESADADPNLEAAAGCGGGKGCCPLPVMPPPSLDAAAAAATICCLSSLANLAKYF